MIQLTNISKNFASQELFNNLNFKLNSGNRIGLVGRNGSGKSTLIKLIASQIHPRQNYTHKKLILGKERYSLSDLRKEMGIITNDLHNYIEDQGKFLTAYEVVISGYYSSIGVFKQIGRASCR